MRESAAIRGAEMAWIDTAACGEQPCCVFVGQDERGHWGGRDSNGLFGGVFVDEQAALRFAASEGALRRPPRAEIRRLDRLGFTTAVARR